MYREAPLVDESVELRVRICSHLDPEELQSLVSMRSTAIQTVLAEVDGHTITRPAASRHARRSLLKTLGPGARVVSVEFSLVSLAERPRGEVAEVIRSLPGSLAYCEP